MNKKSISTLEKFKLEMSFKNYSKNTIDIIELITSNMRVRRHSLKMSQEDVADKAGMTRQRYQRLEKGNVDFNIITLQKLSNALDIDIIKLLKKIES